MAILNFGIVRITTDSSIHNAGGTVVMPIVPPGCIAALPVSRLPFEWCASYDSGEKITREKRKFYAFDSSD